MGEKGEGSGGKGGGKWGRRGREVGGKGEGTGNGAPPCPPPPLWVSGENREFVFTCSRRFKTERTFPLLLKGPVHFRFKGCHM